MSELKLKLKTPVALVDTETLTEQLGTQTEPQTTETPTMDIPSENTSVISENTGAMQESNIEMLSPIETEEEIIDLSAQENSGAEFSNDDVTEDIVPVEVSNTSFENETPEEQAISDTPRAKIGLGSIKATSGNTANTNTITEEEKKEEEERALAEAAALKKQEDSIGEQKMFGNYESSFDKRGQKFLDRLKNLHATPKTRLGFLVMIISITAGVIGGLMVLAPEKHSFSIYKASIIEIYNSQSGEQGPVIKDASTTAKASEIPAVQEVIPTEVQTIDTNAVKKQKVKDYILENYKK